MASILTSITTNKHGIIIRGVRILRSEYDKKTKRDNLRYLGTIPQGTLDIPSTMATCLSRAECKMLALKLSEAAKAYWQQRIDCLNTQLLAAHQGAARIARHCTQSVNSDSGNGDGQ